MATTSANGITIEFETFGDPADPTLLLINGLGSQLINYEPAFCELFTERGFHVVVFDNRDVGLSSKTAGTAPDIAAIMARYRTGEPVTGTPYTLATMAADSFAVLDAVGADRAHIAGMSMGGMIVQRMAIDRPARVLSMTSIMSTTGAPGVGGATAEAGETLLSGPPADRLGYIDHTVETRRIIAGAHFSAEYWREQAGRIYDRSFHPAGTLFQLAAVAADGDRTQELAAVTTPSLVIHGRQDPLIALSGGEATAAAIPGCRLLVIDEMGHDLPPAIFHPVVDAIVYLAKG